VRELHSLPDRNFPFLKLNTGHNGVGKCNGANPMKCLLFRNCYYTRSEETPRILHLMWTQTFINLIDNILSSHATTFRILLYSTFFNLIGSFNWFYIYTIVEYYHVSGTPGTTHHYHFKNKLKISSKL
jgi:hypothetical protein